jgi:hypothetical protein
MPVDLHDRCVNHGVFHIGVIRDGVKYSFENIGFDPMAKSFEHGVPMTEILRQIAPWAPGSHNPQNRLHKQTGIAARPAKAIHEKLLLGA